MIADNSYLSVLGKPIDPLVNEKYRAYILNKMRTLIGDPRSNPNVNPGAQPSSIDGDKMNIILTDKDYYITEKADGERFIMLTVRTQTLIKELKLKPDNLNPILHTLPSKTETSYEPVTTFFISRKLDVYKVDIIYPPVIGNSEKKNIDHQNLALDNALFDGELICDKYKIDNKEKKEILFYIFDTMSYYGGKSIINKKLVQRLEAAKLCLTNKFILDPSTIKYNPMLIKSKAFYHKKEINKMFDQVIPSLPHGNDGIIFTPNNDPYKCGTCSRLIKWKPKELNSIDFAIRKNFVSIIEEVTKNDGSKIRSPVHQRTFFTMHTATDGLITSGKNWWDNKVIVPNAEYVQSFDKFLNKSSKYLITECVPTFDHEGYVVELIENNKVPVVALKRSNKVPLWKIERVRADKLLPNDFHIYDNIMKSVRDSISVDELKRKVLESCKNNMREYGGSSSNLGVRKRSEVSRAVAARRHAALFGTNIESLIFTNEMHKHIKLSKVGFLNNVNVWMHLCSDQSNLEQLMVEIEINFEGVMEME